ncbi:MAG: PBP1A family penicillin-binding protein [Actinobacteria bacterium]|nr:MAG: PBP1A family penicillin-binding protein [Actinomycetota bacterium]
MAAQTHRRRRIRKLRLLALIGVLGVLSVTAFSYGVVLAVSQQLSGLDPSRHQHEQVDGYVYAADGHTILAVLRGSQSRVLAPSSAISPWIKQAIVATEDKRFYQHRGIDIRGMARALWADVRHKGAVQGGSTITQQFVKNALTGDERSVTRKLKEAALAWQLEQKWSKDRILTAYLNTIYFGNGAYGIERAARTYFGHSAAKLTLPEAALLAGIPEDPSLYDPVTHLTSARARRTEVLRLMLQQRVIDGAHYRQAVNAPMPRPQDVHLSGVQGQVPYFGEYVKEQLIQRFGASRVFGSGFRVYTTINLKLQQLARDAVQKILPSPEGPQAALVSINPTDGSVLAMIGGRNFHVSQYNLATARERQTGSAFKPFVLATALREGISPLTTYVSKPVSIFLGNKYWSVHNYEGEYLGPIDLVRAIAVSDNSVFSQLTRDVGPENVVATAHAVGITGPLQGYFAIGLGVEPVSVLEMARAYATFANGGVRVDGTVTGDQPRVVTKIENDANKIVYANVPEGKRALSPEIDALLTQLLEGVVTGGTGTAAQLPGRVVAGKTGTTENYGDAWFCGYTPQLVTCVWVGYPDRLRPMLTDFHGGPVVGGSYPALIWKTFMQPALAAMNTQPKSFPSPPYLGSQARRVTYRDGRIELDNGLCRSTSLIVYFTGRAPSHTADCKRNEVDVPDVVGWTVSGARTRLAAQPLRAQLVYKPASAGQRIGVVLKQYPAGGTLSSFDKVTLVLARPLHGMSLRAARLRLVKLKLVPQATASTGRVVAQKPEPGVAAAPGMKVRLVVR